MGVASLRGRGRRSWFELELELEDIEIAWDIKLGALAAPVKQARNAIAHAEADGATTPWGR
jgi:hypothetical protein